MSALQHTKSFRELLVYQKSRQLSKEIFDLTTSFPKDEKLSSTDQIRRSSRSVGAQIAEAWAKRRYEKHFISKLTDSETGNKWKPNTGWKPLSIVDTSMRKQEINLWINALKRGVC
jgi:hypothetical protein